MLSLARKLQPGLIVKQAQLAVAYQMSLGRRTTSPAAAAAADSLGAHRGRSAQPRTTSTPRSSLGGGPPATMARSPRGSFTAVAALQGSSTRRSSPTAAARSEMAISPSISRRSPAPLPPLLSPTPTTSTLSAGPAAAPLTSSNLRRHTELAAALAESRTSLQDSVLKALEPAILPSVPAASPPPPANPKRLMLTLAMLEALERDTRVPACQLEGPTCNLQFQACQQEDQSGEVKAAALPCSSSPFFSAQQHSAVACPELSRQGSKSPPRDVGNLLEFYTSLVRGSSALEWGSQESSASQLHPEEAPAAATAAAAGGSSLASSLEKLFQEQQQGGHVLNASCGDYADPPCSTVEEAREEEENQSSSSSGDFSEEEDRSRTPSRGSGNSFSGWLSCGGIGPPTGAKWGRMMRGEGILGGFSSEAGGARPALQGRVRAVAAPGGCVASWR
jgi:hypothetical protein